MKKRAFGIIVLIFIAATACGFTLKFDNENPLLKVGLKNMLSNNINITLNGNYVLNNVTMTNGTSFVLTNVNGQIIYNNMPIQSLELVPLDNVSTITLAIGMGKTYKYKGTMDFKVSGTSILPINIIELEEYLKGVVAYEMSNSYPLEALKAQAVAARNYALTNIGKHNSEGYDLCDTTDCQVYKGSNSAYTNVIRAVEETRGKVLVYGDFLVSACYSASSGGYLEASGNIWNKQLPYLLSKKDDMDNEDWPYGNKVLGKADIDKLLKTNKLLKSNETFIKIDINSIKRNESGRVASIDFLYNDVNNIMKRKSMTKEGPRTFLSLPSTFYNVDYDADKDIYTFSGKGYGHGVGLSQIGAKNRANAGQTYSSILAFYFDSTIIVNMKDSLKSDIIDTTGQGINVTTGSPVDILPATTDSSVQMPPKTDTKTPSTSSGSAVKVPTKTTGSGIVIKPNTTGSTTKTPAKTTGSTIVVKPNTTGSTAKPPAKTTGSGIVVKPNTTGSTTKAPAKTTGSAIVVKPNTTGSTTKSPTKTTGSAIVVKPNTTKSTTKAPVKTTGSAIAVQPKTTVSAITVPAKTSGTKAVTKKLNKEWADIINSIAKKSSENKVTSNSKGNNISFPRVLYKGMIGEDVKKLQEALKKLKYLNVANTTKNFDTATEKAVIAFQKNRGLKASGIADKVTLQELTSLLIVFKSDTRITRLA